MKKHALLIAGILAFAISAPTLASERPDHFKGKPAETLEQALSNFSEYNNKLSAIVVRDTLTPLELHQVHELTYTLENALEKIRAELEVLADTLEAVHVASEHSDPETAKVQGKAYLETARKVVK